MSSVHLTKIYELRQRLLHQDLAAAVVQLTLHPDALAFELGNVGLMIDVVGLARVIFQHVLVAGLHNRSRKALAIRNACGGAGGCASVGRGRGRRAVGRGAVVLRAGRR